MLSVTDKNSLRLVYIFCIDTANLERNACKYNPKNICDFLVSIKLDQYVEQFRDHDVDGAMILEFDAEDFAELGVKSDLHKVKIVAHFEHRLKGVIKYPAIMLINILKEIRLECYISQFSANNIDGDMLLVAMNLGIAKSMLKEIGVGGVHSSKIITTFKNKYITK